MIIQNGYVLHHNRLEVGSLRTEGGRVVAIGQAVADNTDDLIVDAAGCFVLPGLIDIHTHGLRDTMPQMGGWGRYAGLQAELGVTTCVPTLFAAPDAIIRSLRAGIEETDRFKRTPNLLGFRLEFPYVVKPGAGLQSALVPISERTTRSLYDAGEGFIRIWDVSPELEGAVPFVEWAADHSIVTSMAHTAANIQQARCAVDAGLSLVTHFYDAFDVAEMTDPGVYPAGLTDYIQVEDRLTVEIIPDGVHVHPLLIEKTLRCKGHERVAFITDSVPGAGSPPGRYAGLYEGAEVDVTPDRGVRRVPDGTLSGSAMTQLRSFQHAVLKFGRSVPQASTLCSGTPARVLGLRRKGYLATGMDADIVVVDMELNVRLTVVQGQVVYQA